MKKAFRSPTKETNKRCGRRREEHDQEEDEEKKIKKWRSIVWKPTNQETASPQTQ
ncbi:unnamed protein product, partial [Vitis vinifera]|uniref:Uncharacterized protein n=1 Tax=Vitis vinifera TaxID=29760 RepID=D7T1Q1_VITVI